MIIKIIFIALMCLIAGQPMRANDEPVVWTCLVETQREIQATGYIEKDKKGYVFKALTGDKVYFESGNTFKKLHKDMTMVRIVAFLVQDGDGDDLADSYCMCISSEQ